MRAAWVLIGVLTVARAAAAASFDCKKAAAAVEKIICSDAQLSGLDARLATSYRRALDSAASPAVLKAEQRAWLATERSKCADVACLERAYQRRLAAIEATGAVAGGTPGAGAAAGRKDPAYSFVQAPFISPEIVEELSTSQADEGDQVVAVNLSDAQGSNRYSNGEIEVAKTAGKNPHVAFRLKGEGDGDNGSEFGYELVGRTSSGIDVLRTSLSGGGSGVFQNLLLVRVEQDAGGSSLAPAGSKSQTMTFKKKRTLIKRLGEIGLGDRWDGSLKVTGNEISIGKDTGTLSDKGGSRSRVVKVELQP